MSEMMPEEDTTFFNYNDDWWNNVGTFAANELLGFDDFQRAFDNMENPNISFWDRAKSLGAGAFELGGTASLFIPGANIVGGASKLPLLGKIAPKVAPYVLPTGKVEKGLLGASMGLGAAEMAAPEDSALATALGTAGLLTIGGIPLTAFASSRRKYGAIPRVTGTVNTPTGAPMPLSLPGRQVPPLPTPTTMSTMQRYNPVRNPRTGRVRGRLGALATLGVLGSGLMGMRGSDAPPVQPYVPTTAPGSVANTITQATTAQDVIDIMRNAQNIERQNILRSRNEALAGFGDAERAALEDYLRVADVAGRTSSQAIRNQYQDFYDRLAGDVAAIEGAGAAGGAAVNRRYRQAARRARREGGRETVRSGVGGLTPVSGALADMPASMRGQGADLATYLRNNAAIAARDAGFDAETSLEYGNAMANQLAADIALMGAGARYTTERDLAAQERNIRSQYDAMLADLANQGTRSEAEFLAQEALREREMQAADITGPELLASPLGGKISTLWSAVNQVLSGNVPEGTPTEYIEQAQVIADLLNARYGRVDLEAYAQYFADNPEMLASLEGV